MKAFLLYRDGDFDLEAPLPWNHEALVQDLELDPLFEAMARGDKFLREVAIKALLGSLTDPESILYRQDVLRDCLKNPRIIRDMYAIILEVIAAERKHYLGLSNYPPGILSRSIDMLELFSGTLRRLKNIASQNLPTFTSEGFTTFFTMLIRELGDDYLARIHDHLKELKFRDGILISAELGKGNKGSGYVLRKLPDKKGGWWDNFMTPRSPGYTFTLNERDETGARVVAELQNRGIHLAANALAQSVDHILSFFNMLKTELAFYLGCLNLSDKLAELGEPLCFPLPVSPDKRKHSFSGLYDLALALRLKQKVVGNTLEAASKKLVIITGANQGGKSTFLRSIGLAQFMMQCGMFVPAESFSANLSDAIFTHFRREEDPEMYSGKLDEELKRMSEIVERLTPRSLVLFNESFAATNEREGSEIARQITRALVEKGIKVFFVTHLYEFAHRFYAEKIEGALFLVAQRQPDGGRTYMMSEGEPLQTSYGQDLYHRIFETGDFFEGNGPIEPGLPTHPGEFH